MALRSRSVATGTRQPERAPAEQAVEADEPLRALLSQPRADLERQADLLQDALDRATVPDLTPHAPRLLALLDDRTFGRANRLVRASVVKAVLRLGYPWALQLPPDDLTLVREDSERVAREGGRRRAVRSALVAAVAVALAGAVLVVGTDGPVKASLVKLFDRAEPEAGPPRSYTVPTAEQLVPAGRRGEVLSQAMLRLEADGHGDEAIAVGLDCLTDPAIDAQACLNAMLRVLTLQAEHAQGVGSRRSDLAGTVIRMRWDVENLAHPPPGTLSYLRELARSTSHVAAPVARAEGLRRAEVLAGQARAALEVGDAAKGLALGNACLKEVPLGIDCHVVLFTAHDLLWVRAAAAEKQVHAEAMERHRLVIATELARATARECASRTQPRPLGCQLGIDRKR